MKTDASYEETVEFHGHSCPGLAVGYRVARVAVRELLVERSVDEELVAVVENDACGVDAVQYLCGCTFGKGNLRFLDHGKPVYTFFRRTDGQGVRIYAEPFHYEDADDARFVELVTKPVLTLEEQDERAQITARRVQRILTHPEDKFIKLSSPQIAMPSPARIFSSENCADCGERIMSTRVQQKETGRALCIPCAEKT